MNEEQTEEKKPNTYAYYGIWKKLTHIQNARINKEEELKKIQANRCSIPRSHTFNNTFFALKNTFCQQNKIHFLFWHSQCDCDCECIYWQMDWRVLCVAVVVVALTDGLSHTDLNHKIICVSVCMNSEHTLVLLCICVFRFCLSLAICAGVHKLTVSERENNIWIGLSNKCLLNWIKTV